MKRHRVTVGRLLMIVAAIALVFGAIRDGSATSCLILLVTTVIGFQAAIVLAVVRTRRARAFWLGFSLVGFPYLVASHAFVVGPWLPTGRLLDSLGRLYPSEDVDLSKPPDPSTRRKFGHSAGGANPGVILRVDGSGKLKGHIGGPPEWYYPIGHTLLAVVFAAAGGIIGVASRAAARRMRFRAIDSGATRHLSEHRG